MLLSIYRRSDYAERKASILSLSSTQRPEHDVMLIRRREYRTKNDDKVLLGFLSLLFYFSLSLSSRGICASSSIYRARRRLWRRKTRQVIDRFLFSLSLVSLLCAPSLILSRCLLNERRESRVRLVFLFLSLYYLSRIAQCDQFSANHQRRPITNFSTLSLSSYRDREFLFSPFLIHRVEEQNAQEEEEEEDDDVEEWQREPVTHRFVWWIFYSAA